MIETERLAIVPFGLKHLTPRYVAWLNDPEVVRYSEQRHRRHTLASCRTYWESFHNSPNFFWALEAHGMPLGHIGTMMAYVDVPNGVADVGILIGERAAWGHGYGLEAWQAVCEWLFATGRVRKITAGTAASNVAMRRIFEKAGMVSDGVRKHQYVIDGKPVDAVYAALFNV